MNHGDPVGQLEYPRWRKIEIPCDYGRDLHPCVIYKDFLIIHDGFTRIALNDVLICNLKTLFWEQLSFSKDVVRIKYDHIAYIHENSNKIIYFGGISYDVGGRNQYILDEIVHATVNESESGKRNSLKMKITGNYRFGSFS